MVNTNQVRAHLRKIKNNQIRRAKEVSKNIAKVEKQIGNERYMSDIAGIRFVKQGPGWVKLKPKTIRRKGHARILFDSGRLKSASKALVRRSFKISGTVWHTLITKLKISYGRYHQLGMGFNPKRPFLKDPSPKELSKAIKRFDFLYAKLIRKG